MAKVCKSTTWSYCEFLEICGSRFDIAIWSSTTQHNLASIVQFLLDGVLGVKPMFIWGVEKCFESSIAHPLNPNL